MLQYLCFIALGLLTTCLQPASKNDPELLGYFKPLQSCDTLHVEISNEEDALSTGDTIPNTLFFRTIPPALLAEIDYLVDSSASVVLGHRYFPLNDSITAFWVELRLSWFQHHSLLLFNKVHQTFTERITLAEWFGGDGGQVLLGSWLFDIDGDGAKDIIQRDIQHSMVPTDDEPLERIHESATVLQFKRGQYSEVPIQDTAAIIRRYPIRTFW